MDPQQRLLMEYGYEAFHGAGLDKAALNNTLTGIFVGIAQQDWSDVVKNSTMGRSVYAATGASLSIAAGRISFVLGLQGPCCSYDTACSAALAANHAASPRAAAQRVQQRAHDRSWDSPHALASASPSRQPA